MASGLGYLVLTYNNSSDIGSLSRTTTIQLTSSGSAPPPSATGASAFAVFPVYAVYGA